MSPMSAESTVVRNYLDWLLSIPWGKAKTKPIDVVKAEEIREEDHYGLEKVKERILEYLAVQARTNSLKGPILCLVGPPGVGKTSLGRSLAKATGREFVRLSLGGVRDEAEIRGHRRTYIGSMPGKIIQSMKKAKTTNTFFLLDEIDKMGADWRGDPSSALLEVLDPEQNNSFNDHYLEVDYDLSQVMFVTTANSLNMPQPLMDRMEIIRLPGYTEDEKVEIAKRHLLPKLAKDHGLKEGEWIVPDEAIHELIRYYTREAGVRSLERELGNFARKAVRDMAVEKTVSITVDSERVAKYAGVRKYRFGETDEVDQVGIVTGLAYTEFGGDILTIEAVKMPGKGRMSITGNLKEVMKESIRGRRFVRACARATHFGIEPPDFEKTDVHVRRAGRRHAQGRSVRRRRHVGGDHLGAHRHPDPQGPGHDRRDHPARPGAGHRRPEGEAAGGPAFGREDGADPARKREGPRRGAGQREGRPGDHPGRHRRRGAGPGAHRPADADRVESRRADQDRRR